MRASDFESRHQILLHFLLVGLAASTYLLSRDDVVWAVVRGHADSAALEHIVFGAGTVAILICAAFETWGRERYRRILRMLLSLALGLLFPIYGAVLLVAGEAFLVARLFLRDRDRVREESSSRALSMWVLGVTMILFTFTLQDRIAEIGAGLSFLTWLLVNSTRGRREIAGN